MTGNPENLKNSLVEMPVRLDAVSSPVVERFLRGEIEKGSTGLLCSFLPTTHMSSAGLHVLFKISRLMQKKNGHFGLCRVGVSVYRVLETTGFHHVLTLYPDEEQAGREWGGGPFEHRSIGM